MQQEEKFILFETKTDKYQSRFWKIFRTYLVFYLLTIFLLLYFNFRNESIITKSCIILLVLFMVIKFYEVKKWVKTKIERIVINTDIYEIDIVEKNKLKRVTISREDLTKKLIWIGRPKILELTVLDKGNIVISVYSAGKTENEYEIEKIAYKLNKAIY